jgi:hypothetical protein
MENRTVLGFQIKFYHKSDYWMYSLWLLSDSLHSPQNHDVSRYDK